MSELVTLSSSDRDFFSYMRGTFSSKHRAIPQHRQIFAEEQPAVTFEIFPLAEVERPPLWRVWLQALRWPYLTFSLSPIMAALAMLYWKGWPVNAGLMLSSVLGVFLFQIAAHFLNDYYDHIKGVDHVHWRGSQIIQKGWLSAHHLWRAAWIAIGSAVLAGVPALLAKPELILIVGAIALLGVIEFTSDHFGLKYKGLGEAALLVLTGPLLSTGLVWTISGRFDHDVVFLGGTFGFLSAFVYYLKNFEEMIVDEISHRNTLARRIGFDRSKKWMERCIWLIPLGLLIRGAVDFDSWLWLLIGLALVWPVSELWKALRGVSSCLSSKIGRVRRHGVRLHFLCGVLMTVVFVIHRLLVL